MKIQELIEKLNELPKDMDVYIHRDVSYFGESGYEPLSEIEVLTQYVHLSKRDIENKTFLAIT